MSGRIKSVKKVGLLMGSKNDLPSLAPAIKKLKDFGVECEVHVMSAHRTPAAAMAFASNAVNNNFGVIMCAAGKAAHLAGVVAAHTTLPVIGIPVKASLEGLDALLSTVQMPAGIPVATVAVDGAENAALLAAQILALGDSELGDKLKQYKADMAESVKQKDAALNEKLEELLK